MRRMGQRVSYHRSQQARKKIEGVWGKVKCWHGFCRVRIFVAFYFQRHTHELNR